MHNSTLIFVYEYEFKKIHKNILENKGKSKVELSNLAFNSHFSKYYNEKSKISTNVNTILYHNLNIDDSFDKFLSTKLDTNSFTLKFFTKILDYSLNKKISNINYDLSNKSNLEKIISSENMIFLNNLKLKNIHYDYFTHSNNIAFYESDKLEEVEETLENLRTKVSNFPIKLIKGVLNKHNINTLIHANTLEKNILFNYRLNNDQVVEKISQVEQF
jgi:hypothetical protein